VGPISRGNANAVLRWKQATSATGVTGLRVADARVIPNVVSGNTNAAAS
jgi:hypothetical protein